MSVFAMAVEPMVRSYPPAPQSAPFLALVKESTGEGQYLVEINAYKGGENRSGGLWTMGEGPMAAVQGGVGTTAGEVTLRYADRHWIGAPTDADEPNTYFEGRVTAPLLIDRAMPLVPEQERRSQRQFGSIEIANGDGELDSIVRSYALDARQVRVLFGPYMAAWASFVVVADVLGTGWEADELTVRIGLRDRGYSLDTPLQESLYAGSGGAEGTSDNEGKPIPLCYGRVRNITPTLIDPVNLIYQVHDGAISAVDDVFDRGAALTDSTNNVATYAALVSQAVSAGEFATARAVGLFKLGATPDGLVTADVRGDATPDYSNTLDVIALRLLRDVAGVPNQFINASTFAGAAAIAGEMGVYVSSSETPSTAQVLSALLASVGGWWGAARDGRIRAGRLTRPELRTPAVSLDQWSILDLRPEETPVPRWRQRVAYQRNWTPQRGEDLAGSVTAARRQFLTEPLRAVTAADGVTRVRHLQALDPDPLPSLYESSADAQTLADHLLALFGPDRMIINVEVKRLGYLLDLNSFVRVTWPRLGLSNGRMFAVIGIREDATTDSTIIRLWG